MGEQKILSGLSDGRNSCTRVGAGLPTNLNQFDRKVRLNFVFTRWSVGIRQRAVSWGGELNRRSKTLRGCLVYDPPNMNEKKTRRWIGRSVTRGRTDMVWSNLCLLNTSPLSFLMWAHVQVFVQEMKGSPSSWLVYCYLLSSTKTDKRPDSKEKTQKVSYVMGKKLLRFGPTLGMPVISIYRQNMMENIRFQYRYTTYYAYRCIANFLLPQNPSCLFESTEKTRSQWKKLGETFILTIMKKEMY